MDASYQQALKQYRAFYKKSAFCGPLLESKQWCPSKYAQLGGVDTVPFIRGAASCLNYANNYTMLIQRFEHNQQYLWEALIKTYPVKKLVEKFKSWCKDNLSKEMQDVSFEDIGERSISGRIIDYIDIPDCYEDKDFPGTLTFYVPVERQEDEKQQESHAEKLALEFADNLYVCGYNLANVSLVDVLSDSPTVAVIAVTFEAKFSHLEFNFSKWLYHVTLLKALKKVKAQGLVPKSQSSVFKYPERVYLFNNAPLNQIVSYATSKAIDSHAQQFALLRVDSSKLQSSQLYKNGKMKFYVDQKFPNVDNTMPDAVYTYGNIPPSLIDDDVSIFTFGEDGVASLERHAKLSEM